MNLHDAIISVLLSKKVPQSFEQIADEINKSDLYLRKDKGLVSGQQIGLRVKKYDSIFINLNGYVVLQSDLKWKKLLATYFSLKIELGSFYSRAELGFVISGLIFYKRLGDLGDTTILSWPNFFSPQFDLNTRGIQAVDDWILHLENIKPFHNNDLEVFKDISHLIQKLTPRKIITIFDILNSLDTHEFFGEDFGRAFEYIIEISISPSEGYPLRTPSRLIELMIKILSPQNGKLYDPVCGTAGLLTETKRFSQNIEVFGSEINNRIAQIGFMNLIMNGDLNANVSAENCFDPKYNYGSYDYIVGDLPFTGQTKHDLRNVLYDYNFPVPDQVKGFGAFILLALSKLKRGGKAIFTISDSFLFASSGSDKIIRDFLVSSDVVESIINLPKGVLKPYTTAKVSLIVVNNDKPSDLQGKVRFINLSNETDDFDIANILESYNSQLFTHLISIQDVLNYGVLHPNYYTDDLYQVRKLLLANEAKYLSDLVMVKSGLKSIKKEDLDTEIGIPYIKIENLERDILDMFLTKDTVKDYIALESLQYFRYIIDEECLLIAKIGDNLKSTIFRPQDNFDKIIIHQNVLALIPRHQGEISLEYLYYQLYSDLTLNQLKQKRATTIMPFTTIPAIKNIIIPFLDKVSQRSFINLQKANIIASEKAKYEEKFKKLGYNEEAQERELNVVRTITHQLRHNLTGISTMVTKLSQIVDKHNLQLYNQYSDDDPILNIEEGFEQPENMSIDDIIKNVSKKATSLNDILLDVEKAINLSIKFKKENITAIFEKAKQQYANKNFKFELIGENIDVELSATHIENIIDTLIQNAIEHSFKDNRTNYKITFSLKADYSRDVLLIEYKNNGQPLLITEEEYKSILTKSIDSNGNGVGGYYVNRVIEAHHGLLTIKENMNKGVLMNIELPLKQSEHE